MSNMYVRMFVSIINISKMRKEKRTICWLEIKYRVVFEYVVFLYRIYYYNYVYK